NAAIKLQIIQEHDSIFYKLLSDDKNLTTYQFGEFACEAGSNRKNSVDLELLKTGLVSKNIDEISINSSAFDSVSNLNELIKYVYVNKNEILFNIHNFLKLRELSRIDNLEEVVLFFAWQLAKSCHLLSSRGNSIDFYP